MCYNQPRFPCCSLFLLLKVTITTIMCLTWWVHEQILTASNVGVALLVEPLLWSRVKSLDNHLLDCDTEKPCERMIINVQREGEGTQDEALRNPSSDRARFRVRSSPSYSVSVVVEVGWEKRECSARDTEVLNGGNKDLVVHCVKCRRKVEKDKDRWERGCCRSVTLLIDSIIAATHSIGIIVGEYRLHWSMDEQTNWDQSLLLKFTNRKKRT